MRGRSLQGTVVRCQIDDDQGREAEGGVRIAVDDASLDWRRHWRCGTLADGTGVGLQLRRLALGPGSPLGILLSVTDEAMAERFYQPGNPTTPGRKRAHCVIG